MDEKQSNYATQLQIRIDELRARLARRIEINDLCHKQDRIGLAALGLSDSQITDLLTPGLFSGHVGYSHSATSTLSADLRRLEGQLARLVNRPDITIKPEKILIYYPTDPGPAIRARLKDTGYCWDREERCWHCARGDQAERLAQELSR